MIYEIVPKIPLWLIDDALFLFPWNSLRNFYLIADVQARTCDYCFHVK